MTEALFRYLLQSTPRVDTKIALPKHWIDSKHDTGPTHWRSGVLASIALTRVVAPTAV
jgi:hypothetical protein